MTADRQYVTARVAALVKHGVIQQGFAGGLRSAAVIAVWYSDVDGVGPDGGGRAPASAASPDDSDLIDGDGGNDTHSTDGDTDDNDDNASAHPDDDAASTGSGGLSPVDGLESPHASSLATSFDATGLDTTLAPVPRHHLAQLDGDTASVVRCYHLHAYCLPTRAAMLPTDVRRWRAMCEVMGRWWIHASQWTTPATSQC